MSKSLASLAILAFTEACLAAALDAPLEPTKPTARTEIYRGNAAVFDCTLRARNDWNAVSQCGYRALDENIQKATATDPFVLGVYLQTWVNAHIVATVTKDGNAERSASGWLDLLRRQQKKTGLSDNDMCAAAKMDCGVLQRMFREADANWGAMAGQSPECLKDGDTVSLAGKVWRETFPGRPNYESIENGDEPETVWVLTLDSPRCVLGMSPEDNKAYEIGKITRFQLVLTPAQYKKHRAVLEHRAEIKGQLFQAISGHHHTKALIEVKELKAVSAK